jgi:hypothetical protein
LFAELSIERLGSLLGSRTGLALAFDKSDGPGNPLFESGEIAAAHGEFAEAILIVHFRRLGVGMFRDLGFQR